MLNLISQEVVFRTLAQVEIYAVVLKQHVLEMRYKFIISKRDRI